MEWWRWIVVLLVGVLLVRVNVWFGVQAWRLATGHRIVKLAPFSVSGEVDKGGQRGLAMARLLLARLSVIRQSLERAKKVQDQAQSRPESLRPAIVNLPLIKLPDGVFEPIQLEATLGGVDVGGILQKLQVWFQADRLIRVSVHHGSKKITAAGRLDPDQERSFLADFDKDIGDRDIIEDIALRLIAERGADGTVGFRPEELRIVLGHAEKIAQLGLKVSRGQAPREEYRRILASFERGIAPGANSAAFLRITAALAESSGVDERQLAYLRMANEERPDDELAAEIAAVEARLEIQESSVPTESRLGALIGLPDREMAREVRVAIVGDAPGSDVTDHDSWYAHSLRRAVLEVAPRAIIEWVPVGLRSGTVSESGLFTALDRAARRAPPVLLMTYGPLTQKYASAFETLTRAGTLVVWAAGNEPEPATWVPATDSVAVVSGVDLDGRRSEFAPKIPDCLWAPAEAMLMVDKREEALRGNSFAAAFVAGAAARVLAEHPDKNPAALLAALRDTSRSRVEDGPAVIDVTAAVAAD